MAAGDLITADYQAQLGDDANAATGAVLLDGTGAGALRLGDFGELFTRKFRTSDLPRVLDHGDFPGTDLLAARDIQLSVRIVDTPSAIQGHLDTLSTVMAPSGAQIPLAFRMPGGSVRSLSVRPRDFAVDTTELAFGTAQAHLRLYAPNPRIVSVVAHAATLSTAPVTGGLSFPLHWPLSFGAAYAEPPTLTNAGNFAAQPGIVIYGPFAGPTVENVTTGEIISTITPVAAGQFLLINSATRQVLLFESADPNLPGASRAGDILAGSVFPSLAPGPNTLTASAQSGTPAVVVLWQDTWI